MSPRLLMILGLATLVASIPLSLVSMTTHYIEYSAERVFDVPAEPVELTSILGVTGAEDLVNLTLSLRNMDNHSSTLMVFDRIVEYSVTVKPGEAVNLTLNHPFYSIMSMENTTLTSITLTGLRAVKPFMALSILSLVTFIVGTVLMATYIYLRTLEKVTSPS
ncbi:hypothetical protein [Desulfurococcus mucosus]|uniref:Uncharacterized protein n=1 Tax=Desulfurococcus mucosus (strain ATCC 35584 / DSM 2162 / JCM 9187 / O7/1) TaxID=765177 RepID=E8R9D2_DESM0|nr:hypothetical protein [Desulfurococcus mucosus]ADV65108.1 hypothetical protein Desmu_0804 [Desulfurococcus mucosus DSM 2162]